MTVTTTPQVRLKPAALGMALFILSESVLFAMLFAAYFYLQSVASEWPPKGVEPPKLASPLIGTAMLLTSSMTMVWAERIGHKNEQGRGLRIGLAITFVLGAAFLSIQALEWKRETLSFSDNAYASLFFTITGFHGAHVIAGLAMNGFTQAVAWSGRLEKENTLVQGISWYWHFVDVVWLLVVAVVYLSPHLAGG